MQKIYYLKVINRARIPRPIRLDAFLKAWSFPANSKPVLSLFLSTQGFLGKCITVNSYKLVFKNSQLVRFIVGASEISEDVSSSPFSYLVPVLHYYYYYCIVQLQLVDPDPPPLASRPSTLLPGGQKFCKITQRGRKHISVGCGILVAVWPPILAESGSKGAEKHFLTNTSFFTGSLEHKSIFCVVNLVLLYYKKYFLPKPF